MRRRTPRRRWCFAALAIALGASAAALTVEGLLRCCAPECFRATLANDPGRYRFRTSQADVRVEINRLGMRGPETSVAKPPGVLRVLCIGDSTTWGESVEWEQTYPMVAADVVGRARVVSDLEMLNLSRPGAGLREYERYWRETGRQLQPEVVVIGFFLGNDMFSTRDPYAAGPAPPVEPRSLLDWVKEHLARRVCIAGIVWRRWTGAEMDIFDLWFGASPEERARTNPLRFENLVERARIEGLSADEVRRRLDAMPPRLVGDALQHRVDPWLLSAAVLHPESISDSERTDLPNIEACWASALDSLDVLLAEIRATGARALVLAIPRAAHVDERYGREFAELGFAIPAGMSTSRVAVARLADHLAGSETAVLDPLPALRECAARSPERLYFRYDEHLTAAGNRILGEQLGRVLVELLTH